MFADVDGLALIKESLLLSNRITREALLSQYSNIPLFFGRFSTPIH